MGIIFVYYFCCIELHYVMSMNGSLYTTQLINITLHGVWIQVNLSWERVKLYEIALRPVSVVIETLNEKPGVDIRKLIHNQPGKHVKEGWKYKNQSDAILPKSRTSMRVIASAIAWLKLLSAMWPHAGKYIYYSIWLCELKSWNEQVNRPS